jgi:hypothetical protein
VRTNQAMRSSANLVDNPERIGPALAQVTRRDETGRDEILGQAWLAAPNRLLTCGHVVERFLTMPQVLSVVFPATGKRYPVLEVRMHPSFVRQPDGLVKFDVALLSVQLGPPDSMALPLPFSYEQSLRTNQKLWTIRFPVHLGQLSAAVQPLSQDGHFLGLLRKHDSFHLLHDVPLAPGDSGAPICDQRGVVAIHCGDTATIPGLNLPTTSIRLALWVDALRELGLAETRKTYIARASRLMTAVGAFVVMFGIAFGAGTLLWHKPEAPKVAIEQPAMLPLSVQFPQRPNEYKKGEPIDIALRPGSPVYSFLLLSLKGAVMPLFPPGDLPYLLKDPTVIDRSTVIGNQRPDTLKAPAKDAVTLYVLALKADDPEAAKFAEELKPKTTLEESVKAEKQLLMKDELLKKVSDFERNHPASVVLTEFDIPPGK